MESSTKVVSHNRLKSQILQLDHKISDLEIELEYLIKRYKWFCLQMLVFRNVKCGDGFVEDLLLLNK